MAFIVAGLGNPGEEYEFTRHNVGRMVVTELAGILDADTSWRSDKKLHAQVSGATLDDGTRITLVLPDNYMNRSGGAVAPLISSAKGAKNLIVVHDDIDLPFGTIRIVFDRGSGGHRGVDSIIKALHTRAFIRVRVGVLQITPGGKVRKPKGAEAVHSFILKPLSTKDRDSYSEFVRSVAEAVHCIILDGLDEAMRTFNGVGIHLSQKKHKPAQKHA